MKAIKTTYLGPTNFKGSRIKATDEDGNSITVSRDDSLNVDQDMYRAACLLHEKMGWPPGRLVGGGLRDCMVWVQAFNDCADYDSLRKAAVAAYRYADFSECAEIMDMLKSALGVEAVRS